MAAFSINRKEIIDISDSEGIPIFKGDPILLRIKGEDIVCRFKSITNGYFTTDTLDGEHENKYRFSSIEKCIRISGIKSYPGEKSVTTAQYADEEALAPTT